jgi:plasmid stabilization system protein ParE
VTHRIRIAPEAEAELSAAALWYESKRAGLGADFVAAIDVALESIGERPLSFQVWRMEMPFRRHVVDRFPFVIFFTMTAEGLEVFAVAHAKRKPGYWLDR